MAIVSQFDSPIGKLRISSDGGALVGLEFDDLAPKSADPVRPVPARIGAALRAYFDGATTALDSLQVQLSGTPFQKEVWGALRSIPAGQVWSYAQLASAVGRPTAFRAVGVANGRNPVALVVPCHRVIASGGTLGGYGGGLRRKAWLLRHERVLLDV